MTFYFNRDIFYTDTLCFANQRVVDNIINDISCMLKIPRRSLHIVKYQIAFFKMVYKSVKGFWEGSN